MGGRLVCPAKGKELEILRGAATIKRLTTTTSVRKLVFVYTQRSTNVCVCVCVCMCVCLCVAHGTGRGSEDEKGREKVVVCPFSGGSVYRKCVPESVLPHE